MASNYGYAVNAGWKGLMYEIGVNPADALRLAKLPEDLFSRADVRLRAEQFFAFAQALQDLCPDPLFPLVLTEAMSAELFSPPIFAALCSPNLEIAASRLARFKPLIAPIELDIEVSSSQMKITYIWHDTTIKPPSTMIGAEPLFMVKLARMGTRAELCASAATMPALPPRPEAYEEYLGCKIEQSPQHSISFHIEDARRPFITSNGAMWDIFEPQLDRRLVELDQRMSFEHKTRTVLLEALPSGQVSVDFVARTLATSSRTLQRKLKQEGTTFNELVRETRESLAIHYLSNTNYSSSEIAYLLGFEEPTSFFRAFQAWTGQTPEGMRSEHVSNLTH